MKIYNVPNGSYYGNPPQCQIANSTNCCARIPAITYVPPTTAAGYFFEEEDHHLRADATCPGFAGGQIIDSDTYVFGVIKVPSGCDASETGVGTMIDSNGIHFDVSGTTPDANTVFITSTSANLPAGTTINGQPISALTTNEFVMALVPGVGVSTNLPQTASYPLETPSSTFIVPGPSAPSGYQDYFNTVYNFPLLMSNDAVINYINVAANFAVVSNDPATANSSMTAHKIFVQVVAYDYFATPEPTLNYSEKLYLSNGEPLVVPDANTDITPQFLEYYNWPTDANNLPYQINFPVKAGNRVGAVIGWEGSLGDANTANATWVTYNLGYTPSA